MADVVQEPPAEPESAESESSEAQIAVHWREEEYFPPPAAFKEQANAGDEEILERFREDRFPDSFAEYAELLDWDRK
ncbi:MAG: acetyl-coenzyme A synthetase, partial [Solirubrobacteraceae bacterium]